MLLARNVVSYFFVATLLCCCGSGKQVVDVAAQGDLDDMKRLILQGANVNAFALDDWTPLTIASREGHLHMVKFLVENGADVNQMEGGGNTALFWAAFGGHADIVKFLLQNGADPQLFGSESNSLPLAIALQRNHVDVAALLVEFSTK